jgi:hypothetical protein
LGPARQVTTLGISSAFSNFSARIATTTLQCEKRGAPTEADAPL